MDFKNTVFLPQTSFAIKANLSQKEPDYLKYWQDMNLYQKLREQSKGKPKFIIHFGPPYANGHIHIGHALNGILKDIVNKNYQMMGYDAPLVLGWDCHGLPIEWKIEESYRANGLDKDSIALPEFRTQCRSFAQKWTDVQKNEFKRLGLISDWQRPYSTMGFTPEAAIIEELGKFLLNGSLYRGLKPVLWSVVEKTALADAEVEYKDRTSDSIYVAFPIIKTPHVKLNGAYAVVWTTTPWTLPGNRAIAYGKEISYVIVYDKTASKKYLVAQELFPAFAEIISLKDYEILSVLPGFQLEKTVCDHPFHQQEYDFDVPLLPGDHVTTESGTGLVHTAPGHGLEDFEIGKKFNLEIPETIGIDGRYESHVPLFSGKHIFKVNPEIIEALHQAGYLLHAGKLIHSYPHSWRSKTPLIYRTTTQWFINMEAHNLRQKALKAITDDVEWYPHQGRNRIYAMIETRPDWCISRQRVWGTPLSVFVHKKTGTVLRDPKIHERIVNAVKKEGTDAWFKSDGSEFLEPDYAVEDYEKVNDIIDVWFDSGCTHGFVLTQHPDLSWPATLFFEGSDQHRGWFQSSLLESCATRDRAPYQHVCTHGFVLDEKGHKMSKSLGNVIAPEKVIDTMGADILRLWAAFVDYTDDVRIGPDVLKHQEDIYRRFRNTIRYLLGILSNFSEEERIDIKAMPSLEQWILHRVYSLNEFHKECLKKYDIMSFYNTLHTFCVSELSAFYFDIRKDSLYCDEASSIKRRSVRTVMDVLFTCLTKWLAPVLSFTTEEAFLCRYGQNGNSIHLQQMPILPNEWNQKDLEEKWTVIRDVRRVITGALEIERVAKTIGSSLQAHIVVYVSSDIAQTLKDVDLSELAIISKAKLLIAQPIANAFFLDDVKDVGVVVNQASGKKCNRCWRIFEETEQSKDERYQNLCHRCEKVIKTGRT